MRRTFALLTIAFVAELGVGHFSRRAGTRAELYVERGTNLLTCKIGASPVSRMSSGTTRPGAQHALGECTAPGAGTTIGAVGLSSHLIGDSHTVPSNDGFGGTAQYVDVTAYGARVLSGAPPQTTVTVRGGSTAATLAATGTFRNGDGVVIYGAGATNTMTTPSAPTVTASIGSSLMFTGRTITGNNARGATRYAYEIEARDQNGGLTAASPDGMIANGVATLGTTSGTIRSSSRSGSTVTVTMSAPFPTVAGALVYVYNSSDASFSGYYAMATAPDRTHFTYTQGTDTRGGATTSSTGGTAVVYLCNHVTWTAVTGAFQYYIYGRTAGSENLIGISRPGELFFDDYGSAATANLTVPSYVTSTPNGAATNDNFSTTIVSGAGTTSVTLANAVTNGVAGAKFLFDDAPGILAAANAAKTAGAILYFPSSGSFVVNSALNLGQGLSVKQSAPLTINETIQIGQAVNWSGDSGNGNGSGTAPQFSWVRATRIVANAYPAVLETNANSVHFDWLTFAVPTQGLGMMVSNGNFNFTMDYSNFIVSCCNGLDYTGMGFYSIAANEMIFRHVTFTTSPPAGAGTTTTPIMFFRDGITGGVGHFEFRDCYEAYRGIGIDSASGTGTVVSNLYAQALQAPMFTINPTAFGNAAIRFENSNSDTSNQPYLVTLGVAGSLFLTWENNAGAQAEAGGFPGSINGITAVDSKFSANTGTNSKGVIRTITGMRVPFWDPSQAAQAIGQPDFQVNSALHFPANYTLYFDLQPPSGLAISVPAGGSIAAGTYWFGITATGFDGGETKLSAPVSCTTTPGSQTCALTWTAEEGAASYSVYAGSTPAGAGHTNANAGCTQITATSCTFTTLTLSGGQSAPAGTGTGLTTVLTNEVITPIFQCNAFVTVASLPAASASKGRWTCVGDSTAIVTEGQPAVGGSTHVAAVFSDGTKWKAF